ncbi:hypothetical protein F183_A46600 [Bryobacterales bacterium F-183]|nr:hypothetical protein F183_A46600 [Bryobacterales bacterium F-183]
MSEKYYLKIDGINGDVTDKGYEKTIRLLHYAFQKAENTDDAPVDVVKNPGSIIGRPAYSKEELAAIAEYGTASPKLFQAAVIKESFKTAALYVVRTGARPTLIKKYSFYGVRVAGYQVGSGGDGSRLPTDQIVLKFLLVK